MNNIDTPLRSRIEALSEVVFKPTFTFFDNTLLINYKKTGSRFFQILCKAPIGNPYEDRPDGDKFSTQIDAEFKLIKNFKTDYNILNLKNVNYLVDFKFDDRRARAIDDLIRPVSRQHLKRGDNPPTYFIQKLRRQRQKRSALRPQLQAIRSKQRLCCFLDAFVGMIQQIDSQLGKPAPKPCRQIVFSNTG